MTHAAFTALVASPLLLTGLAVLAPSASAQTAATPSATPRVITVTYLLDNVWLNPDIANPGNYPPQQMTGTFEWTYTIGSFDNGTGQFTSANIPWYGTDYPSLNINIETNSIEFVLPGSYHDLGLDLTLFLLPSLAPDQPSGIDPVRSRFDIQRGVSYQGHVISGSIVSIGSSRLPDSSLSLSLASACPSLQLSADRATPNGRIALLYALDQGSFVIPGGLPCAATTLGLGSPVALFAVITADANGQASLLAKLPAAACGKVYFQMLDLGSCAASQVVLLR